MALRSKFDDVIAYDLVRKCDYEGISLLCKLKGWKISPEDVQDYSSFLPAAAVVARSGGRPVGMYPCIEPIEFFTNNRFFYDLSTTQNN